MADGVWTQTTPNKQFILNSLFINFEGTTRTVKSLNFSFSLDEPYSNPLQITHLLVYATYGT